VGVAFQQDLGGQGVFEHCDAGEAGEGGEGELDVGAGGVAAGVEDAGEGVGALAGEGDLAVDGIEGDAQTDEVVDAVGGTSAAAPHVAGVLALLKSTDAGGPPFYPDPGNEDVEALKDTAVDLGVVGCDNVYGFGRVNAVRAAQALVLLATIDNPTADITIAPGQSLNFLGTCNDDPLAPPARRGGRA
jgi:subtilisin family serine protease